MRNPTLSLFLLCLLFSSLAFSDDAKAKRKPTADKATTKTEEPVKKDPSGNAWQKVESKASTWRKEMFPAGDESAKVAEDWVELQAGKGSSPLEGGFKNPDIWEARQKFSETAEKLAADFSSGKLTKPVNGQNVVITEWADFAAELEARGKQSELITDQGAGTAKAIALRVAKMADPKPVEQEEAKRRPSDFHSEPIPESGGTLQAVPLTPNQLSAQRFIKSVDLAEEYIVKVGDSVRETLTAAQPSPREEREEREKKEKKEKDDKDAVPQLPLMMGGGGQGAGGGGAAGGGAGAAGSGSSSSPSKAAETAANNVMSALSRGAMEPFLKLPPVAADSGKSPQPTLAEAGPVATPSLGFPTSSVGRGVASATGQGGSSSKAPAAQPLQQLGTGVSGTPIPVGKNAFENTAGLATGKSDTGGALVGSKGTTTSEEGTLSGVRGGEYDPDEGLGDPARSVIAGGGAAEGGGAADDGEDASKGSKGGSGGGGGYGGEINEGRAVGRNGPKDTFGYMKLSVLGYARWIWDACKSEERKKIGVCSNQSVTSELERRGIKAGGKVKGYSREEREAVARELSGK